MQIPKKIKILGVEYKINRKEIIQDFDGNDNERFIGVTDEAMRTINLANRKSLSKSLKEQTFFHEVVHATLFETGLSHLINDEHNEVFAQSIGNAMWQVFKQLR